MENRMVKNQPLSGYFCQFVTRLTPAPNSLPAIGNYRSVISAVHRRQSLHTAEPDLGQASTTFPPTGPQLSRGTNEPSYCQPRGFDSIVGC